jgi:hypothetical protein
MVYSLKRHGADPKEDATETILRMRHATRIDCTPEEASTFLTELKTAVKNQNAEPPVPIELPVLNVDGSKGFVKGDFTWRFSWRELFNDEEGRFRMKATDGYTGWFDVVLNASTETYTVTRVEEQVFGRR